MNYLVATKPMVDGHVVVERSLLTGSELAVGDVVYVVSVVSGAERVLRGSIVVLQEKPTEYLLQLEQIQELSIPAPLACVLIVGACRPQSLKKTIHHAATLGVKQIYLVGTEQGERSYLSSTVLSEEGITRELLLAAAQSGDPVLPQVLVVEKLWNFPWDQLPNQRVLLDTAAVQPFALNAGGGLLAIAIGAESGWSRNEISYFERQGFQTVRFGERILRVEVAVAAALGVVLGGRG